MKDIFLDANIVKNFTNPLDPEYHKLIRWLLKNDEGDLINNAFLVFSTKLNVEYKNTCRDANTPTCIHVIVDQLTRDERLNSFTKAQICDFKRIYYKKRRENILLCKGNDKDYFIPMIMMSDRKYALVIDDNFHNDINNFPKFKARAEKRPELLPYDV